MPLTLGPTVGVSHDHDGGADQPVTAKAGAGAKPLARLSSIGDQPNAALGQLEVPGVKRGL